jgi:hypothetical protein
MKLEAEIKSIKSAVLASRTTLPTGKRLISMVRKAKRDVVGGRGVRGDLRALAK